MTTPKLGYNEMYLVPKHIWGLVKSQVNEAQSHSLNEINDIRDTTERSSANLSSTNYDNTSGGSELSSTVTPSTYAGLSTMNQTTVQADVHAPPRDSIGTTRDTSGELSTTRHDDTFKTAPESEPSEFDKTIIPSPKKKSAKSDSKSKDSTYIDDTERYSNTPGPARFKAKTNTERKFIPYRRPQLDKTSEIEVDKTYKPDKTSQLSNYSTYTPRSDQSRLPHTIQDIEVNENFDPPRASSPVSDQSHQKATKRRRSSSISTMSTKRVSYAEPESDLPYVKPFPQCRKKQKEPFNRSRCKNQNCNWK